MAVPFINDKTLTMLVGTGVGKFTHRIKRCLVPGRVKAFYRKEMESQTIALIEVLAQEFFRLIAPWQPQTYIAFNSNVHTYLILSEGVDGYKPLPTGEQDNFTQGKYPGLGQLMLIAVFLQEIDLKNRNIGLNRQGQVVKIDGDWCFAAIRDADFINYQKDITSKLLDSLPFPIGYTAFNWLDLYQEAVAAFNSNVVDVNLANAPHFRNEINEAILKILILPDEYLKRFVDAFTPFSVKADVFITFLKSRREELKCAALQNTSFKKYLLGEVGKTVVQQHIAHMNGFTVNGQYSIIEDKLKGDISDKALRLHDDLVEDIFSEAFKLLDDMEIDYSSANTTTELFAYRDRLLGQINQCMDGFIKPQNEQLLAKYNALVLRADEKIKLINSSSNQLEQHFLFLEQIHYAKHIEIFTQKQSQMEKKAIKNSNYIKAAHATQVFGDALKNAKRAFLALNKPYEENKKEFISQCTQAVTDAKEELKHHREWIGAIRKFFIEIISFLTKGLLGSKLSMFAKTDSAQKLDNFEQKVTSTLS